MSELIGLPILGLLVLVFAGVIVYFVLRRFAALQFLSGPMDLVRDLLSNKERSGDVRGLNRAMRDLIRRTWAPGPNEPVALTLAAIRIHPEDLSMLKRTYSLADYTHELGIYQRKVASRKQWRFAFDRDLLEVRFMEDPSRRRMHPGLDAISSAADLPGGTKLFNSQGALPETVPFDPSRASAVTERPARISGDGVDVALYGSQAPFTIGRAPGNFLVLKEPTVHREHARLDYADGHWTLVPLKLANATTVNNVRISAPTRITDDCTLGFGEAEGYSFKLASGSSH